MKFVQSWLGDLRQLHSVNFPRRVVDQCNDNILVIFCDASKNAYGFISYGVSILGSNILFSKTKIAPLKTKTLPTLELLAMFLALKCLSVQLKVESLSISQVYISSDSQVALSWVISRNVKSKNVFANNRVKDIHDILKEVKENHIIECSFRYIPTELNPSDLITRGLTFSRFSATLQFWREGPAFLKTIPIE